MKRTLLFVGLATLLAGGQAQSQMPAAGHTMLTPAEFKWAPAPPGLPPGAEAALLEGDPAIAGKSFTLRVKLPDGYKVPPHWHPADEHVTVLSGTLMFGMGETFDVGKMKALTAGSFALAAKDTRHFVQAKGATVIQVHATGPFGITYVSAADDPRLKKPSN
jgi:quercetin dioxygenase-like cupin family protein